jgi:hypothetical protein
LRNLETLGTIEGTRLMLWGASGGVDRITQQLAKPMDTQVLLLHHRRTLTPSSDNANIKALSLQSF